MIHILSRRLVVLPLLLLLAAAAPATGGSSVAELVTQDDEAGLRAVGPQVMPEILRLYETGDTAQRLRIASLLYRLAWQSPEAARVLLRDAHTRDPALRIEVQYALGRISSDPKVLDTLLDTMQHDANPLFREKAACALANDQIHLTEAQKVKLYEGLIAALASDQRPVRFRALRVLMELTGQDKGYIVTSPPEERAKAIERWKRWLAEYRKNL